MYNTAMLPWTDIILAIKWYSAIFILGVLGWTLLLPYAKKLPGHGYAGGRAVGLVLVSGLIWILSVLHIFDFTSQNIWAIVLISFVFLWKKRKDVLLSARENLKEILISELVTIFLFVLAIWAKSNKPGITDIEKYMDIAFLNAVMRTTSGVPVDPWYAGSVINYYYVGHWFMATVAKMTSIASNFAFNLSYATILAIAGANIFLAGWSLSNRKLGGILSVFFAVLSSNIHPLLAWIHHTPNYFFFSSGRFIEQVINEYPLYSFVVGDVHAHSISLILTTCCVLISIVLFQQEKENYFVIGFLGFLVGMMTGVNAFDVINLGFLSGLVIFIFWLRNTPTFVKGVRILSAFSASAFVPFIIFKSNFIAPVGGVGFTFLATPITHVLMQFGIFFFVIFAFLVTAFALYKKDIISNFKKFTTIKSTLPTLKAVSGESIIIFVLAISGFVLALLPQFAFFKDIYFLQNPPFARANTVFKVWYEAWMILGILSGVLGTIFYSWLSKKFSAKGKVIAIVVLLLPISVGMYGANVGLKTMTDSLPNTIDGLDYTRHYEGPQDYQIVKWANENIKGQPIVLEATGQSYSTYNWFSAFTGLPTIIGWESHEWGWRYDKDAWNKIGLKMGQVEIIYKTKDSLALKALAQAGKIEYILVSPNEKTLYGANNDVMKKAFGDPVFDDGKSALYRTGYKI
jgi:YYY domain-containing protein